MLIEKKKKKANKPKVKKKIIFLPCIILFFLWRLFLWLKELSEQGHVAIWVSN